MSKLGIILLKKDNFVFVNADDPKNAHLLSLEGAKDRLELLRVDLLDCESLRVAFAGCQGVFHTASPVTDDPVSLNDKHC